MEFDGQQMMIEEGTDVYGSDGAKVGSVVAVQPSYLVVEKGFFFPTDYYIPRSALASYDDGKLFLSVSKEEALSQGWDQAPQEDTVVTSASADDTRLEDATLTPDPTLQSAGATADPTWSEPERGWTDSERGAAATDTQSVATDETLRVPVHEETLTATTRERELGQVEVEKEVVTEEQTLEVPVREERVHVARHAVDRPAAAGEMDAFEDQVIEVPVRGETVETHKDVRVSEELEIGKEAVERTEAVSDTVRREEVQVRELESRDRPTTDTTESTDLWPGEMPRGGPKSPPIGHQA